MNHSQVIPPPAKTWRDIPQAVAPRAMSREGKKRQALASVRVVLGIVVAGLAAWAGWELFTTWRDEPTRIAAPVKSNPLREITLRTDGVLTRDWAEAHLALPTGIDLMELDLGALQQRLLATGQVRTAILSRAFPDTLAIVVEERSPVLRVMAADPGGEPRALLVARDGTVYSGNNYDAALLKSLPWLDGVRLVRDADGGFQPISGMESVAELLGTALASAPPIYRSFMIVSLGRLATDGVIVVRSRLVEEIVFGLHTQKDFFGQIARLDYILDETRRSPDAPPLRSVNLAVGGRQVPVSLDPVHRVALHNAPAAPVFPSRLTTPPPARRSRDL